MVMKIWLIATFAVCGATANTALATTLPPQRESAILANMMPALPAPAATRSERDYFQAPAVQSELATHLSCRLAVTPVRIDAASRFPLCD
jgi:hypothetical protein